MADKPLLTPEWNSDDTNQTEPLEAKKDEGWLATEDPSSAYFNWWMNLVWKWIVWLDARATNLGIAPRIGLRGIDTTGEGGNPGIMSTGDGVGPGGDFTGGGTSGPGMLAQGGAPNGPGGAMAGTGTGKGLGLVGGAASGNALEATGGTPNGNAIIANGVGTGSALEATGVDGYGVVAASDTSTPIRAALRLVPQDTDPSSPQMGDIYANSGDGTLRWYDGSIWRTFSAVLPGQQVGYKRESESGLVSNLASPAVPLDDTLPQNTEGSEMITIDYTPTKIGNILRVRAKLILFTSAADVVSTALFKDTDVDAVSASSEDSDGGTSAISAIIDHEEEIVSLDTVTWKIRVGAVSVRDIYMNGAGVRVFAGVANSFIEVTEIEQ